MSSSGEARWLLDLVAAGRMSVPEVCELLAVPNDVRAVWLDAAASDPDLGLFIFNAIVFRSRVAEKFDRLLSEPIQHPPRQAKIIQRGKKRDVRLPVAREAMIPATQAAQEPCGDAASV